jgi:hypothetical protein
MQSNKDHAVYSDFVSSKPKCKPEGYHALCVQCVALSCCTSAKQMAKSKQCKVPTQQGQRLDHATKLEASRTTLNPCNCGRDRGELALCTAPALLQCSLHRHRRSDCSRDRGEPAQGTAAALQQASLHRHRRSTDIADPKKNAISFACPPRHQDLSLVTSAAPLSHLLS